MSIFNPAVSGRERTRLRKAKTPVFVRLPPEPAAHPALAPEPYFLQALSLERKRAERSGKHFLLMLLEAPELFPPGSAARAAVTAALAACTRETDLQGWYRQDAALGVIFTEVGLDTAEATREVLHAKVSAALRERLGPEERQRMVITFHLFPEASHPGEWCAQDSALYPDVRERGGERRLALVIKRLLDAGASATALLLFSPLLALIAAAIKLTSQGPVLYRQVRIGQYGRRFTFLKFRSMYVNSSASIHQAYVQSLIRGKGEVPAEGSRPSPAGPAPDPVYKLTRDPRVTPLGRWLRKTSLDELPQFLNVLLGQMSLVGPRPPIPYELEAYDAWHRRRLLEAKPGVTGLWQVSGRSRTTFDEMVRLDLRYAKAWSLWLDLRILAQTPRAVLSGEGAY